MNNKKRMFEVQVTLKVIDTTDQYSNKAVAKIDLAEVVPDGIEPVDHLRNLVKANFARVFGPVGVITVEQSEEF